MTKITYKAIYATKTYYLSDQEMTSFNANWINAENLID